MDVASTRFSSNRKETDAPVIYHYTDPKGLIGILSDDQLWATDIRYLNDSSELRHTELMHRQILEELIAQSPPGSVRHKLATRARDQRPVGATDKTYVICFSETDDLLTQWKTYGSWGAGFSIGFDRAQLEASLNALSPPSTGASDLYGLGLGYTQSQVVRVQYSEEEQRVELRRVFAKYLALLSDKSSSSKINNCAAAIADNAALSASQFKHPGFAAEAEWRIIVSCHWMGKLDDVFFRPSSRTVIPYVKTGKLPNAKLPVVSVTIGPTLDQDLSRQSVLTLLVRKGYYEDRRQVEIKTSSIPLVRMD
jgi:hypothetical protein